MIDNEYDEDIASLAFAQITSLPFAPNYNPPAQVLAVSNSYLIYIIKRVQVSTSVNPIDPEQTTDVPWWLYLLAILIALLILALIIYCCYRVSLVCSFQPLILIFSVAFSNAIDHNIRKPNSTRESRNTTTNQPNFTNLFL
jgi:hypothetical protein